MKVFISWSGTLSRNLAEILREWLPLVLHAVRPYFSPEDAIKGTLWAQEISKELEESTIGIICLTRDNLSAPWLLFEAGALSKNSYRARVCPILFNLKSHDVQGPLLQFQLAEFEKTEIWRLVKMMNELLGDSALTADVLFQVWDVWWPKLKEKVDSELSSHKNSGSVGIRTERDLLEEVLALARANVIRADLRGTGVLYAAAHDMISRYESLVAQCISLGMVGELRRSLLSLEGPIGYMIQGPIVSGSREEKLMERLKRVEITLNGGSSDGS